MMSAMSGLPVVKRSEWLVACDDSMSVCHDAVIAADSSGNIAYAGSLAEAPPSVATAAKTIPEPAEGSVILPGFVNSHAHTPMAILRGAGDGLPIDAWLADCIWPAENRMTDEDAYHGCVLGINEMLISGITASAEMYEYEIAVIQAFLDMGMRVVMAPTIFDKRLNQRLHAVDRLRASVAREPLVEVAVGLHAIYSCGIDVCRVGFEYAAANGMRTHIHLAEVHSETRHGGSPSSTELLCAAGMLQAPLTAAHGSLLDSHDISLLSQSDHDVGVAHCPVSNMNVGTGTADFVGLQAAGVRVGIGTDGPASAGQLDMFESMRCALLNARLRHGTPAALGAEQVLLAATAGSAHTAGVPTGFLEAGRPADFLLMQTGRHNAVVRFAGRLNSAEDVMPAVVWHGRPEDIDEVWVAGQLAAKNGTAVQHDIRDSLAHVHRRRPQLLA